jgi:hypothetical protein
MAETGTAIKPTQLISKIPAAEGDRHGSIRVWARLEDSGDRRSQLGYALRFQTFV